MKQVTSLEVPDMDSMLRGLAPQFSEAKAENCGVAAVAKAVQTPKRMVMEGSCILFEWSLARCVARGYN